MFFFWMGTLLCVFAGGGTLYRVMAHGATLIALSPKTGEGSLNNAMFWLLGDKGIVLVVLLLCLGVLLSAWALVNGTSNFPMMDVAHMVTLPTLAYIFNMRTPLANLDPQRIVVQKTVKVFWDCSMSEKIAALAPGVIFLATAAAMLAMLIAPVVASYIDDRRDKA